MSDRENKSHPLKVKKRFPTTPLDTDRAIKPPGRVNGWPVIPESNARRKIMQDGLDLSPENSTVAKLAISVKPGQIYLLLIKIYCAIASPCLA
jgi:hypothetical protein